VTRRACVVESHRLVSEALAQWNAGDVAAFERACELLRSAVTVLEQAVRNAAPDGETEALAVELESLRRDVARLGRKIDISQSFHRRVGLFVPNSETEVKIEAAETRA
jgi:hypothetical protein